MWLIAGQFDGEVKGGVHPQKTKLLKTGTSYPLGRKDSKLIINNARISKEHCEIIVGQYPLEYMGNPSFIPTLEIFNKRDKPMKFMRGEEEVHVNPSATYELQDGDKVNVANGIQIEFKWHHINCYLPLGRGKSSISLEACAQLGISVVHSPSSHVTHHLTPSYTQTATIATSLLSASQLIKSDWLSEVIRLGNLPSDNDPSTGIALSDTFAFPPTAKYRPTFAPSLPPEFKVFKVWEPNEERLNFLLGYRFVFIGEKGREIESDSRELVARGGGTWEGFSVGAGRSKFHQVLAKGCDKIKKDKGKALVPVADETAMKAAVGDDQWQDLVDEARSFELHILTVNIIIKSIMQVDSSLLVPTTMRVEDAPYHILSPLPDFVPNTHPDELSPPSQELEEMPAPLKRLTRRVTAFRQASQEPTSDSVPQPQPQPEDLPAPPRKQLTRRVNNSRPLIIGFDDPSSIMNAPPELSVVTDPPPAPVIPSVYKDPLTAPTPARSSRLKRRVGTTLTLDSSQGLSLLGELHESDEVEPPLKKFKILFEASDPHRDGNPSQFEETAISGAVENNVLPENISTQSQSHTQAPKRIRRGGLGAVREEEEEETPAHASGSGTLKRKTMEGGPEEDVEMNPTFESGGPTKKRTMEHINAVEHIEQIQLPGAVAGGAVSSKVPTSKNQAPVRTGKAGATPGRHDTDSTFLKAIASTKRGKKQEDDFDREFNKLKIFKPNLAVAREEEGAEAWKVLEEFGDDGDMRGNFMVVVEIDVSRIEKTGEEKRIREEWQGKPNFKKFKKKGEGDAITRKRVELAVSEGNDYGMGSAYWKGGHSQSQLQGGFAATQKQLQFRLKPTVQSQRNKARPTIIEDEDEEEADTVGPRKGKCKPPSRADPQSTTQKRISARTGAKAKGKLQPLFLYSDNEVDNTGNGDFDEGNEESEPEETLMSNGVSKTQGLRKSARMPPSKTKKPVAIIVDDDSDDGATFKGFCGKK